MQRALLGLGLLLLPALLVVTGCDDRRGGRGDDDSAPLDDDDSEPDDDDDTTVDDDDASGDPTAPVIVEIEVCQVTFSGNSFGLFNVDVIDPDGDLVEPILYRLQIDSGSLVTHEYDDSFGEAGTIAHTEVVANTAMPRGSDHDFHFSVLDAGGHLSDTVSIDWVIPLSIEGDPCG